MGRLVAWQAKRDAGGVHSPPPSGGCGLANKEHRLIPIPNTQPSTTKHCSHHATASGRPRIVFFVLRSHQSNHLLKG